MAELAGLILAAGTSSRMGAFKPMLQVDGQTMIRRVADMMRRAGAGPVAVVTGYRGGSWSGTWRGWTSISKGCGRWAIPTPTWPGLPPPSAWISRRRPRRRSR